MRHFTIDQSGKVEDTSVDTILAFSSNEMQYSIKIPKYLKQNIFSQCQKKYKTNLALRLFSYGLYLLLKEETNNESVVIIDDEYPGHSKDIKQYLMQHSNLQKEQIRFELIGKKDQAHKIAYMTFCGKIKPNRIVNERDLNLSLIVQGGRIKELLK